MLLWAVCSGFVRRHVHVSPKENTNLDGRLDTLFSLWWWPYWLGSTVCGEITSQHKSQKHSTANFCCQCHTARHGKIRRILRDKNWSHFVSDDGLGLAVEKADHLRRAVSRGGSVWGHALTMEDGFVLGRHEWLLDRARTCAHHACPVWTKRHMKTVPDTALSNMLWMKTSRFYFSERQESKTSIANVNFK